MKRSGFASRRPPARVREWEGESPRAIDRRAIMARIPGNDEVFVVPIGKLRGFQSGPYMAAVRTFACARCSWFQKGGIQFCHRDEGKGLGLKTDCREGWPGCGPHDGLPGCHWIVGTSGQLKKAERRAFEAAAGASTRAKVLDAGLWPARLPRWEE